MGSEARESNEVGHSRFLNLKRLMGQRTPYSDCRKTNGIRSFPIYHRIASGYMIPKLVRVMKSDTPGF